MSEIIELKFPCAVRIRDISCEEVFDKILDAFIKAGATVSDSTYSEGWNFFGVDDYNETELYDNLDGYSDELDVTVYTVEEVLSYLEGEKNTKEFLVNEQGGVKDTIGKLDWCLLPINALREVVKVLDYGAKKYSKDNWQKVEPYEYKKAAFRHWTAYVEGEKNDPETGLSHLAHLACDVLFLLWFELKGE